MSQSIRASDRDRDVVVRVLGEQAGVGRLTIVELEQRTERALTATTRGELVALTVDMPVDPDFDAEFDAQQPDGARARRVPLCLACLVPVALGLLAGAVGIPASVATLVGIVVAAVLCVLLTRTGVSS